MESAQQWLGVSFCHSFSRAPYNRQFDARHVLSYAKHFKDEQDIAQLHLHLVEEYGRNRLTGDALSALQRF